MISGAAVSRPESLEQRIVAAVAGFWTMRLETSTRKGKRRAGSHNAQEQRQRTIDT